MHYFSKPSCCDCGYIIMILLVSYERNEMTQKFNAVYKKHLQTFLIQLL